MARQGKARKGKFIYVVQFIHINSKCFTDEQIKHHRRIVRGRGHVKEVISNAGCAGPDRFFQCAWWLSFVPLNEHMMCDLELTSLVWGSSQTSFCSSHEYFIRCGHPHGHSPDRCFRKTAHLAM